MIAKIISWGPDRPAAIQCCVQALLGMELVGVPTTASLHQDVLAATDFIEARLQVGIIPGRPDLSDSAQAGKDL
jgi:acetyl/propionyl-CoA carboxylase alpha subunit